MDGEPPFTNQAAKYREGTCPQSYWQKIPVTKEEQDKKIMLKDYKNLEDLETFTVHWHSKALVDGFFRDWVGKGIFENKTFNDQNRMTVWPGVQSLPDMFTLNNLQVLWA